MADAKISTLTAASAAAAAQEFPVNESGTTKKVTGAQIVTLATTAPVFAAGSATASSKPKLSSGTVLTTAEAGAIEYDGAAEYFTIDTTSGRAQRQTQQVFRLAANGSAIGGTIADYFGANSAFPTVGSAVYELTFYLWYLKTTAGTVTYTLTNTQTYTNLVASYVQDPTAGLAANGALTGAGLVTNTTAAAALPATPSLTLSTNHFAIVRALAEVGTAGNIRLRVTCSAGTLTPLRGSYYTARRLAAGNVGTFVA